MKSKAKSNSGNGKTKKKTRGYRLKPSTHLLIGKIQELMHSDQDEAIAGACSMFFTELQKNRTAKPSSKFNEAKKITIINTHKG